jgi:hypothetical protein
MSAMPIRLRCGYTLTEAYRLVRGVESRPGLGDDDPAPTQNVISRGGAQGRAGPNSNEEPRRSA